MARVALRTVFVTLLLCLLIALLFLRMEIGNIPSIILEHSTAHLRSYNTTFEGLSDDGISFVRGAASSQSIAVESIMTQINSSTTSIFSGLKILNISDASIIKHRLRQSQMSNSNLPTTSKSTNIESTNISEIIKFGKNNIIGPFPKAIKNETYLKLFGAQKSYLNVAQAQDMVSLS